jgi:hypothetical protein
MDPECKPQGVAGPSSAVGYVTQKNTKDTGRQGDEPDQDSRRGDRHKHIHEESTDLLRKGAAELVVGQEDPYVGTVAAVALGLAGTSACSVYLDMAK